MADVGFQNIDQLPLGKILQVSYGKKSLGKKKRRSTSISKLLANGFKKGKKD